MSAWFVCNAALAQQTPAPYASQPIGGDNSYAMVPPGGIPVSWNASDESWYETNRALALAGKIITVVGWGIIVGGAVADSDALVWTGYGTKSVGEIGWSIADLRCANRMSRRGMDVRNAAGITAVIGSLVFSPVTWISGPIQSMRIRDAHNSLVMASAQPPRMQALGSTLSLRF